MLNYFLQTRDPGISGKTMVTMMKSLPIPEEMKLKLLSLLKLNCNSTMQDQKVFILLILLVVINNESEIVLRDLHMNIRVQC